MRDFKSVGKIVGGYEGEGIVHICHCVNCGAEIQYFVPLNDENDNVDND